MYSDDPVRVTTTGNASLFHGVPDCVYEEEVFGDDYALWWSPDATKLAFLRFDETAVDEFSFPVYNPSDDSYAVVPYPSHVTMKYPKPGYANPLVSVHVFRLHSYRAVLQEAGEANVNKSLLAQQATVQLEWAGHTTPQDRIVAEVAWVGDDALLVREVTRAAEDGDVIMFDMTTHTWFQGTAVRRLGKDGEQGDAGWIEAVRGAWGPVRRELTWF